MNNRYVLGIDIGIASVGWAVLNKDTHEIVENGVLIFQDGRRKSNADRRGYRSQRRLKSRKATRLKDAQNYLRSIGVEAPQNNNSSPYDLRLKGLSEKLTNEEFYIAYMHLVKNRGSSFETVETDISDDEKSAKSNLQKHERQIKEGMFPVEIQLDNLNSEGKIRGPGNVFKTKHYVLELKKILENQSFNEDQQKRLIEFLERRRSFEDGPGSYNSPTPYGRFIEQADGSILEINLIEKMRGKCSVYPDELRAPRYAFSAELFNFLNDLNNLTIYENNETRKLSQEEKQLILEKGIYEKKLPGYTPNELSKALSIPLQDITGFRIDTKERPLLSPFDGTREILKAVDYSIPLFGNEVVFDTIADILTQTKVFESRKERLSKALAGKLSEMQIECISQISKISQYHSLSLKVMNEFREQQISESKNHMQILSEKALLKNHAEHFKGKSKIDFDGSQILNPVVRKASQQAFKLINAVRKVYGELDAIIIEMPRDSNSEEKRKRIRDTQKRNEQLNNEVLIEATKATGKEKSRSSLNYNTRLKIRLYMQQDGKCVYTGKPLDLKSIVDGYDHYEIDHIIPLSISFDDSMNNKVLVTHRANQDKGQRTPYQAFQENKFVGWTYDQFYQYVFAQRNNKKFSNRKLANLLYVDSINKYENLEKFISRNLVDTRYASRVVLNTLQSYFRVNNLDTSILTINGSVTSQFRNKIDLPKDRDENFEHHAVDAAIIALMSEKKAFYDILKSKDNVLLNPQDDYYDSDFIMLISKVKNLSNVKITHKVDKKPNRSVSDETIYSTRIQSDGQEYVIKKRKDIYGPEGLAVFKDFLSNTRGKNYLIAEHDPNTYQLLLDIVDSFSQDNRIKNPKNLNDNPFLDYKEKHGPIRKVSKNNNGPIITNLKYRDSKLGNHIDITPKDKNGKSIVDKKRVVLLQISPYRTDFYIDKDGRYKFLTIRYNHVQYSASSKKNYIDPSVYESLMADKKISNNDEFAFSLHRGEFVNIVRKVKEGVENETWSFIATNSDFKNVIEVKPTDRNTEKRIMVTIGGTLQSMTKINTDILGNQYPISKEALKLEF